MSAANRLSLEDSENRRAGTKLEQPLPAALPLIALITAALRLRRLID